MQLQTMTTAMAVVALMGTTLPASAQDNAAQANSQVDATASAKAAGAAVARVAYVEDGASPFGTPTFTNADSRSMKMPVLHFTEDAAAAGDFDKYYYFHRADTDFATAYGDVRECDGYARGLQSGIGLVQTPYPYAGTMAGAVGGAIGNAMAVAIFGSSEKRRMRRVNMRTCMYFKGYERFGLSKALWEEFNFEEGLSGVSEGRREAYLKIQALVAATAKPEGKVLGL
jgi:hypothetical protein